MHVSAKRIACIVHDLASWGLTRIHHIFALGSYPFTNSHVDKRGNGFERLTALHFFTYCFREAREGN